MAKGYFRIPKGLELDSAIQILTGSGIPGVAGDPSTALVGSFYSDYTNAKFYKKHTGGAGVDKWVEIVDKTYVDSLVAGISWREPAVALDSTTYLDITAAETAANLSNTVDGVTIADGDRVLFTDLTTGNENVYIVSGSIGAWTFTEDPDNTATDGDAIMIESGSSAEDQYAYNGTEWVRIGGSLNNLELQYIRDYIGKTSAGIESPTYTEQNFITTGDNLESAIDKLDIEIGANVVDGEYILAVNDINENITALDDAIAELHDETETLGVTTLVTVGTVDNSTSEHDVVKWIVRAYDSVNSRFYSAEIIGMHDGAGNTDLTVYAELRLGSGKITGLDWDVVMSGTDILLKAESTNSVDIRVRRIVTL